MPRLCFHFQGTSYSYNQCLTLCCLFHSGFNSYYPKVPPDLAKLSTCCLSTFYLIPILFTQHRHPVPHSWKLYLSTLQKYIKLWLKPVVYEPSLSFLQSEFCMPPRILFESFKKNNTRLGCYVFAFKKASRKSMPSTGKRSWLTLQWSNITQKDTYFHSLPHYPEQLNRNSHPIPHKSNKLL